MQNNTTLLEWNSYRYLPYEKELAQREVAALLRPDMVIETDDGIQVTGKFNSAQLKTLVYFSRYRTNGNASATIQNDLERSCTITGSQRRQSTRYSVHGMHEYKGKFNPQIVRGILNILGVKPDSKIVDPFCGSGTSLVECAHIGMRAVGYDINPLAVYIANAKLKALATSAEMLRTLFLQLVNSFEQKDKKGFTPTLAADNERGEYLWNWFDKDILLAIEHLRFLIQELHTNYRDIFFVLVSDLLRDYSLQEPSDLRIRRRTSAYPSLSFWEAFKRKGLLFLDNLAAVQTVIGIKTKQCGAHLFDSRNADSLLKPIAPATGYQAAITSPPYATALPYIDTQRLSLVWLELASPKEIGELEAQLTGSREFVGEQKRCWSDSLISNRKELPNKIHEYCMELQKAVSKNDGFRRRSVPILMYRYLSNMHDVFRSMHQVMHPLAPFALVMGHNKTTLGGKTFHIDTPALLQEIASTCGWSWEESIPLQTYQRYGLHAANAVKMETLLILRRL